MSDSANWDVILRLAIQGDRQTKKSLDDIQRAADQLNKEGKLTEQQYKKTSETLIRAGRASSSAASDTRKHTESLNAQRYALYDIAQTYGAYSAVVIGAGAATATAFAKQERAFTDVQRTAEGSLDGIRESLYELSTAIPVSFTDLAQIATLGNQLGVAAGDLEAFTKTVSAFSTVTGITAEASAQAFGRIGNLLKIPASQYENLASAITYTGRTSAATEKEIISLTERLAASASRAGFAQSEVIGLAGALGSLGVAPERAQGVFETYFNSLNESLAEGGDRAKLFASIVGTSVEELNSMVVNGQGLQVFESFLRTLGDPSVNNVQLTDALDQLGLSGLRANEVIGRISQNLPLLEKSLNDANTAWAEGTELQSQMALILDDLSTRWTTMVNAVVNFASAIGGALAPVLGPVMDTLKNVLIAITQFIQTPIGSAITQIVAVLAGATAAFALYRTGVALAAATTIALRTAQGQLVGTGLLTTLSQLAGALGLVSASGTGAAGALTVLRGAMVRLLGATGIGAALVLIGSALVDLRGTALAAIDVFEFFLNTTMVWDDAIKIAIGTVFGLVNAFNYLTGSTQNAAQTIGSGFEAIGRFVQSIITIVQVAAQQVVRVFTLVPQIIGAAFQQIAKIVGPVLQGVVSAVGAAAAAIRAVLAPILNLAGAFGEGFAQGFQIADDSLKQALGAMRDFANTLPSTIDVGDVFDAGPVEDFNSAVGDGVGDLDNLGNAADNAAEKVRTLVDYASDLSSVWTRAFDIRFGPQAALDAITTSFQEVREATAQAEANIRSLNAEISGINSDINLQNYFLGVANQYGDAKRAQAITANLAKLQADLQSKTADLEKEQQAQSKTLTGNTAASLKNRDTVRNLVTQYQAHIQALAESGLSQEELARRTEELRADFVQQATQLGFNRAELGLYEQSFYDVSVAIRNVPRNITVSANVDPALQALNEFAAKAAESASRAGTGAGNSFSNAFGGATRNNPAEMPIRPVIDYAYLISQQDELRRRIGDPKARIALGPGGQGGTTLYANGGYTGPGGRMEPAGIVHRGEYVIPKRDVNQRTGLPKADALGRLHPGTPGRTGYAGGGYVSGAGFNGTITGYSPMAMQQMMAAFQQYITLDSGRVAQASSNQYARSTALGAS